MIIQLIRDLSGKLPPDSLINFYLSAIMNKGDLSWENLLVSIPKSKCK
jgi:hypothetical protein